MPPVLTKSSPSPPRKWQFSLLSLLLVMGVIGVALAVWRASESRSFGLYGVRLVGQYLALIYAVAPWFAYLAVESLPIHQRLLRVTLANSLLMTIFFAGLKIAESWFGWPAVFYLTAITGLLWTPQYVAFFWRRAAGI